MIYDDDDDDDDDADVYFPYKYEDILPFNRSFIP